MRQTRQTGLILLIAVAIAITLAVPAHATTTLWPLVNDTEEQTIPAGDSVAIPVEGYIAPFTETATPVPSPAATPTPTASSGEAPRTGGMSGAELYALIGLTAIFALFCLRLRREEQAGSQE